MWFTAWVPVTDRWLKKRVFTDFGRASCLLIDVASNGNDQAPVKSRRKKLWELETSLLVLRWACLGRKPAKFVKFCGDCAPKVHMSHGKA
jgi:hypothetical protein